MPRLPVIRRLAADAPADAPAGPSGMCELVSGGDHLGKVVRRGLGDARVSVDVMTADLKAMLVPSGPHDRSAVSVIEIFRRLAQKGVEVRVLHAGVPSSAALRELSGKPLPPNLVLRRCPRLHAKAVVVDARAMYLGSANLTGAGLGAKAEGRRNFELGLWTEEPLLIDAVLGQFNALWEGHECQTCRRRDVCPVPLEEPDF